MADYYVTELLPADGYQESWANGINNFGTVAGKCSNGDENFSAVSWSGGSFLHPPKATILPDLPEFIERQSHEANAINDAGTLVGKVAIMGAHFAIIWNDSGAATLNNPMSTADSEAYGINNSGWVVGDSQNQNVNTSPPDPYLWNSTYGNVEIGNLIGELYGINNQNIMVGEYEDKPAMWQIFGPNPSAPIFLNDYGTNSREAKGINDYNDIVGAINTPDSPRPVIWNHNGGAPSFLDTGFPISKGEAMAINNHRQVVGWYAAAADPNQLNAFICETAFYQLLFPPNGQSVFFPFNYSMIDLNTLIEPNSGWHLQYATGINNKRQICGYGTFNGEQRAFRLDPTYYYRVGPYANDRGPMAIRRPSESMDEQINFSSHMLPALDARIRQIIQNIMYIVNVGHASYESRKRMVDEIEKFVQSLRKHK